MLMVSPAQADSRIETTGVTHTIRFVNGKLQLPDGAKVDKPKCWRKAKAALKKYDPEGWAVYREIAKQDERLFWLWLACDTPMYGLPVAVHESVHIIGNTSKASRNGQRSAFRLMGGEMVSLAHQDLVPRKAIDRYLESWERDEYRANYLEGPGAEQGLMSLLDELNAYVYTLSSGRALRPTLEKGYSSSSRDGLSAFLRYLQLYVHHLARAEPEHYTALRSDPATLRLIARLWRDAEREIRRASHVDDLSVSDRPRLKLVYSRAGMSPLKALFRSTGVTFRPDMRMAAGLDLDRPAAKTTGSTTQVYIINGKRWTEAELVEAAKTDPEARQYLELVRNRKP